jgi:hypothetical protein
MAKRTQPLIADRQLESDPLQEFLASRWSRVGIAAASAALVAARLGGVAFAYEHSADGSQPYQPDSMAGYDPGYDAPQWIQVDDKKGGKGGDSKPAPAAKGGGDNHQAPAAKGGDNKPAPAAKGGDNKPAPAAKADAKSGGQAQKAEPMKVEAPKGEEHSGGGQAAEQPKHEPKAQEGGSFAQTSSNGNHNQASGPLPGGTMGKSHSNPDGGGVDKPYPADGQAAGSQANTGFQDGNNGCGQDKHIDGGGDDNNGWCGAKPKPAKPAHVVFQQPVATNTGGSTANPCVCVEDTNAQVTVDDKDRFFVKVDEKKKDKVHLESDQNDTSAIKVKAGDVDRVSMHFQDKDNVRVRVDDHNKVTFKIADKDQSKVHVNVDNDNPNAGSIKLNLNDSQNVHFVCDTDENGNVVVHVNVTEHGKVSGDHDQKFFNVNFGGEDKFHFMVADKDRNDISMKTSGAAKDTLSIKAKNEDVDRVKVQFEDQSNIKFQTADKASFHISDKVKDKIKLHMTGDKSGSLQLNGVDAHDVHFVCHFDTNGNLIVDVDTVPTTQGTGTNVNPGTGTQGNANPPVDVAGNGNANLPDTDKVTICHATGSASNPFVQITIPWVAAIHAHLPVSAGGDTIGGGGHEGPGGEDFVLMSGGSCEHPNGTTGGMTGGNLPGTPGTPGGPAVQENTGGNVNPPVNPNTPNANTGTTPPTTTNTTNTTNNTTITNNTTTTTTTPTTPAPTVAEIIATNGPLTPAQSAAVANVLGGGITPSTVAAMSPGEIQSAANAAGVTPEVIGGALAAPVDTNTGMASFVPANQGEEATLGESFSRSFDNVVASVMPSTGEPALGILAASLAALGGAGLFLRRFGRK